MDLSLPGRVTHAVDAWLAWLPRWKPGTHRARTRLCRDCFGSPVVVAAGLADDVPHAVQHALSVRIKRIIDAEVDEYTARNLPTLHRELKTMEELKSKSRYRPSEGLDPEFDGLDLDPEPEPGRPYLFTLSELAQTSAESEPLPPPPLTPEQKDALRSEIALADEYAKLVGSRICQELTGQKSRIRMAVARFVEPQIEALLAELTLRLDAPGL